MTVLPFLLPTNLTGLVESETHSTIDEEFLSVSLGVDNTINASIFDAGISTTLNSVMLDVELIPYDVILTVAEEDDDVYDVETDFSAPGVYYIGQAAAGSSTSDPVWRIRKVTENLSGTSIDWAGGNAEFTNVWDDRLSFVYGP